MAMPLLADVKAARYPRKLVPGGHAEKDALIGCGCVIVLG